MRLWRIIGRLGADLVKMQGGAVEIGAGSVVSVDPGATIRIASSASAAAMPVGAAMLTSARR